MAQALQAANAEALLAVPWPAAKGCLTALEAAADLAESP